MVKLAREHRPVHRDHRDPQRLAALLGQQLAGAESRRWQQHTGRRVRRVLQALIAAEHSDQHLDLVVIGRNVLVVDRPVEAEAIALARLEVVRPHAQRDASPVVGPAAEHARSPPHPVAVPVATLVPLAVVFGVVAGHVRLARHPPTTVDRGIVKPERLVGGRPSDQRRVGVGLKHWRLPDRVVIAAGLQHHDLRPRQRQGVCGLRTRRARPDHDHVVGPPRLTALGSLAALDDRHRPRR